MLIQPNWDNFKAKFHDNPQKIFEWFCYLLFCREFELEKGWYGFKNQSAIEKEPLNIGSDRIGFQAKFYETNLSDHKDDFIRMLNTAKRDYENLNKIYIYTNQEWTQVYNRQLQRMDYSTAYKEITQLSNQLGIEIIWHDKSFFESEFVTLIHNDLSDYFFNNNYYIGWHRFDDWSNNKMPLDSTYITDDNIKIISPKRKNEKAITIIEGLNEIRQDLSKQKSVRLVGLSGVGKTRFAQALFDDIIGNNALDKKSVWYCDNGTSPQPTPEQLIQSIHHNKDEKIIFIIDNCGKDLHANLTKLIKNHQNTSLLTIEYDIKDDLPEETEVYKIQPTTPEILKKVIAIHYPDISQANIEAISEFSGGNYRLAMVICSNINKTDNISILTDEHLFNRIFFQNDEIDTEIIKVAQIFSLVYSFNIEDGNTESSEINFLSEFAEVSTRTAYRIIDNLYSKDIVQKRGNFRAILPHVLANKLAMQGINSLSDGDINNFLTSSPKRLQTSFIKRLSYLHNNDKVIQIIKSWFNDNGYFGQKIINNNLDNTDYLQISCLVVLCPEKVIDCIEIAYQNNYDFLSIKNQNHEKISKLLAQSACLDNTFHRAFLLLFQIYKTQEHDSKEHSANHYCKSLFHHYFSYSQATYETKKNIINEMLSDSANDFYLLQIIDAILDTNSISFVCHEDNGMIQNYGYQAKTYEELLDWFDFALNTLFIIADRQPIQAKKVFTSNIKNTIWACGTTKIAIKYIKLFHEKEPFYSALIAIKNILKYHKNLLANHPEIINEMNDLKTYLSPTKSDIKGLIECSIIHNHLEPPDNIFISSFNNFDDLINHICENMTMSDTQPLFNKLMLSGNFAVKKISYHIARIYNDNNKLINDIVNALDENNHPYFFLNGILSYFIENNFNDYQIVFNQLINHKQINKVLLIIVADISTTKEHYDFAMDFMANSDDVYGIGRAIVLNKLHQKISNDVFEYFLDNMIENNKYAIVSEIIVHELMFNHEISDKYIESLMSCLPHIMDCDINKYSAFYDYQYYFNKLLTHSDKTRKHLYQSINDKMQEVPYIALSSNTFICSLFELMIENDTYEFLDFIYLNKNFKKIFLTSNFTDILNKADESQVLQWADKNPLKIAFWFQHAKLCHHNNQEIHWSPTLTALLEFSSNPTNDLQNIIANILYVGVWGGNLSNVMKNRLLILKDLHKLLEKHEKLSRFQSQINQKIYDYEQDIEREIQNELKEQEENNRFDW